MKKICLVRNERLYWETIESYLTSVNARTEVLTADPGNERILTCHPDLIITDARTHRSLSSRIRQRPVIVIKEGAPPIVMFRRNDDRNLFITGWPLAREQFLDITSRMLSVAPRRSFRTLIRIFPEGDRLGFLGQSQDFSLSGMAFTSEGDLVPGAVVTVSFSLPSSTESVRLEGEVVRRGEADEEARTVYGVRFSDPGTAKRTVLNSFILDR